MAIQFSAKNVRSNFFVPKPVTLQFVVEFLKDISNVPFKNFYQMT